MVKSNKKEWVNPKISTIKLSDTKGGANPVFSERFNTASYPSGTPLFGGS